MASTPPYFYKTFTPFTTSKLQRYQPVRSQSFRDEGKSANNIVDANMIILRKRIEEERRKERVNNTWNNSSQEMNGWKYKAAGYDDTYKRRVLFVEYFELAALVGRNVGLVFLSGFIFVFLYSLLMHINIHT